MSGLVGRKVLVLFEDGQGVGRREGTVTALDEFAITIDSKDVIPRTRIVRLEVRA